MVIPGSYDHVELVLGALELPFATVHAAQLPRVGLRPEQVLVLNCPGHLPEPAIRQVREFVRRGGTLFSTDWTLRNVLEPAFPAYLEYNDRPTADDVVRIEIHDREHRFLKGVMEEGDEPVWWLESSSYPIHILEPERVEVLLSSKELEGKYGEAPVAVTFRHGEGEVFHMISHYFLQRTELRSKRRALDAAIFHGPAGRGPTGNLPSCVSSGPPAGGPGEAGSPGREEEEEEGTMTCFLCGGLARPQVIRTLSSSRGPRGWARVCVPCAIAHEIEGILLAGPRDREMADRWRAHRSEDD